MRVLDNAPSLTDTVVEEDMDERAAFRDTTNTQESDRYQNSDYIGPIINEDKNDGVYRIIGGNPNGLTLNAKGGDYSEYLEEVKRMGADTIALYEINLDTQKSQVKKLLYDTSQQVFDHQRVTFTSSTIPSKNQYKPGGTLILTNGKASGRVVDAGTDDLGRWTYQTLTCKGTRKITVISAYQV